MQSSLFKNRYLAAFILFIFSFLIYLPSLQNNFVWDDVIEIKKNYFKFEKTSLVKSIFPEKSAKKKKGYFRPVTYLTLGYDYKIWGDNPFGFHLTNVLLNSISTILLFFLFLLILRRFEIEGKEVIAFFSTLLFTVHPMHVESVSWIAGRTDILCSLFFIAAFISHIKSNDKTYFIILTCFLFYISILSKELAVAFPFTVLAYDVIAEKKISKKSALRFALYMIFFVLYFLIKSKGGNQVTPDIYTDIASGSTVLVKYFYLVKTLFIAYLFYFYKLITPFWFSSFISNIPKGSIYFSMSLMCFVLLGYLFYYSYKKKSGFKSFCLLWLLLVIGPSSLIAVMLISSTPLAERYLYLPIAPFSLIVVFMLYKMFELKRFQTLSIIAFCAVFLVFGFLTILRQATWQDRVTFWADAARNTDNAIPLINYGMALIDNNKLEEGIEVLKMGLESDKKTSKLLKAAALNNLGIAYLKQGQGRKAEETFQEAIKVDKIFYKSYYHLGIIYYSAGKRKNSPERLELSKDYFFQAVNLKKNYARAYLGIARVYVELGDLGNAKQYAKKALNYGLIAPLDQQALKILNTN